MITNVFSWLCEGVSHWDFWEGGYELRDGANVNIYEIEPWVMIPDDI